MFRLILWTGCMSILSLTAACRSRKPIPAEDRWAQGFHGIPWGSPAAAVDSLLGVDTSWTRAGMIVTRPDHGTTHVLRQGHREYYIDFNASGQLAAVSYLSNKDKLPDVVERTYRFYGEPDRLDSQSSFTNREWTAGNDTFQIELQILETENMFSFFVRNTTLRR